MYIKSQVLGFIGSLSMASLRTTHSQYENTSTPAKGFFFFARYIYHLKGNQFFFYHFKSNPFLVQNESKNIMCFLFVELQMIPIEGSL